METLPPSMIANEWSRYVQLRESGLKKQANQALLTAIEKIEKSQSTEVKEFLLSLCDVGLGQRPEQRIQHPIYARCILPLLLNGLKENSAREITYIIRSRYCGFAKEVYNAIGDIDSKDLLRAALISDPNNTDVINLLVKNYVEDLYFGAHHLPEALIVDLGYAQELLQESADFISRHRYQVSAQLIEEYKYYSALYSDYAEWESSRGTLDFAAWCTLHKREYTWVTAVYYDK